MIKIPIEDTKRPTCACGEKMELANFAGYYDEFRFWVCTKCPIDKEIQDQNIQAERDFAGRWEKGEPR